MDNGSSDYIGAFRGIDIHGFIVVALENKSVLGITVDDPMQDLHSAVSTMVGGDLPDFVGIGLGDDYEIASEVNRVHAYAMSDHVRDLMGADAPQADGRHPKDGGRG
ncbi:hypothetical protein [Actinoplanes awajinensis]|uniref:Uncharacterized protein n=1 Tax=Actinoplanes awajinensis subsp. mycoplanecinus TaxID=135947 RepID=A0A0X3UVH7_9ACTN|nr:hypothetical protein [Actinoplanes awajinensis]KUL36549.1 hypothetical protein ADL15_11885 [Actinoplanes awajinensis subsp. mycoplanecinus]